MSDKRQDFLIAWYQTLWSNIDRSFSSIWQTVALLGSTIAISYGVISDNVPPFEGTVLGLVVAYWAIFMVIDSNLWYLRNLAFISGVERELLRSEDYGKIIPTQYRNIRPYGFIDFYLINLCLCCFAISAFLYVYVSKVRVTDIRDLCSWKSAILLVLAVTLGASAYAYHRKRRREYETEIRALG